MNDSYVDQDSGNLPSPFVFNHVVVKITKNNIHIRFIDPTLSYQGGGVSVNYLPNFTEGLVIRKGIMAVSAMESENAGSIVWNDDFYLQESEGCKVISLLTRSMFEHGEADLLRAKWNGQDHRKTEDEMLQFYQNTYRSYQVELADTLEVFDQLLANNISTVGRFYLKEIVQDGKEVSPFVVIGKHFLDKINVVDNYDENAPFC